MSDLKGDELVLRPGFAEAQNHTRLSTGFQTRLHFSRPLGQSMTRSPQLHLIQLLKPRQLPRGKIPVSSRHPSVRDAAPSFADQALVAAEPSGGPRED